MNSAAIGIGYALWLRIWWMLYGLLATVVTFAIAEQFASNDMNEFLVPTALLAVLLQLFPVLSALTYSPADLGSKASGFPSHMLVLPVSTRWLSGWPILFCSAIFAITWFLLAGLILMPVGFHPPIFWPAAVVAAATAWIQAVAWTPFPSPFARVPALVGALLPIVFLMFWPALNAQNQSVSILAALGGAAWWLVAYGVAINGLARTRCGSQGDWFAWLAVRWQARMKSNAATVDTHAAFRSADSAQLWYERRRNVRSIVGFVAALMILLLVGLCSNVFTATNNGLAIPPAMLSLGAAIFMPILLATMYGPGFGKFDVFGSEQAPSFFTVRPMTSTRFISIKLKAAAVCALAIWSCILFVLCVWAGLEASPLNPHPSLVRGFFADASLKNLAAAAVFLVGVLFLIWRNIVVGMWPTLSGRKWFSNTLSIPSFLLVLSLPGLAGLFARQPKLYEKLIAATPWLLGVAVVVKVCAAVWVGTAIQRRALLAGREIGLACGAWALAVAGFTAIGAALVDWTWYLPVGAVLLTPLVRIGLAPLALDWNRHR